GKLLEVPGQVTIFSAAAPAVFVPKKSIEATNLLKKGSRVNHRYYFKIAENTDLNAFVQKIKPFLAPQRINLETVASRQKQVSRAFDQLTNFLNIVGFTALLLGCLGVASAIRVYMRTKIPSVAVLRCLGVSAMKVMGIFLVQVIVVGFLSSLVGAILGSLIQKVLPFVVGDFLPVEVSTDFSPYAFGQGLLTGVLISVLFTLMPLLQLRDISPLAILRTDALSDNERSTLYRRMYSLALLLFVAIGTFFIELWQLKNVRQTALFTLVLLAVLSILVLAAHAIVRFVRYVLLKTSLNFLWRQGIASLQRPQNQTLLLIVSIGLGTALISTLFFTQEMLLARLRLSSQENLANFMCFDIQTEQKEAVKELLHNEGAIILQEVPVVSGRIESLNGITKQHLEKDSTSDIPKWVFNNELRFSYRNNLLESETTLQGIWEKGKNRQGDTLFISINKDFASMTKLSLGDNIVFNIHGVPFYTRVGHIREVDFSRLQSSFMMIFPEGVLEQAPQFHIVMARIKDKPTMARIQRLLFKTFPNVSVIDLETAINTLEKILNKVNFAIRFMAIFSIITGFFVLASTTAVSKVQRIKESVLLRTLGASQRQIFFINAIEYGVLGFLAAFTGVCLAIGISSLLASQTF
ncbi:MAG: FtsX-like permease family protein, partial [Flammeovirgaceae bacterium]|nr:FtsX-like permease family protein [Flammeovirgaceae bacterium]